MALEITQGPINGEQRDKMWYVHATKHSTAGQMDELHHTPLNFTGVAPRARYHTAKQTDRRTPVMQGSETGKIMPGDRGLTSGYF